MVHQTVRLSAVYDITFSLPIQQPPEPIVRAAASRPALSARSASPASVRAPQQRRGRHQPADRRDVVTVRATKLRAPRPLTLRASDVAYAVQLRTTRYLSRTVPIVATDAFRSVATSIARTWQVATARRNHSRLIAKDVVFERCQI